MQIYKTPEEASIGTLFLIGFVIVILALLVSFSTADGSAALTTSGFLL